MSVSISEGNILIECEKVRLTLSATEEFYAFLRAELQTELFRHIRRLAEINCEGTLKEVLESIEELERRQKTSESPSKRRPDLLDPLMSAIQEIDKAEAASKKSGRASKRSPSNNND